MATVLVLWFEFHADRNIGFLDGHPLLMSYSCHFTSDMELGLRTTKVERTPILPLPREVEYEGAI